MFSRLRDPGGSAILVGTEKGEHVASDAKKELLDRLVKSQSPDDIALIEQKLQILQRYEEE